MLRDHITKGVWSCFLAATHPHYNVVEMEVFYVFSTLPLAWDVLTLEKRHAMCPRQRLVDLSDTKTKRGVRRQRIATLWKLAESTTTLDEQATATTVR